MGLTAALKLRSVANNLETILALELLCSAQGIDFRRRAIGQDKRLGSGTAGIYNAIREHIPFVEKDEYLKDHMDAAIEIARSS